MLNPNIWNRESGIVQVRAEAKVPEISDLLWPAPSGFPIRLTCCPSETPKSCPPFQDMFVVAVSLVSGKILYISSQVASIFHCKQDTFSDAKFVEFLAPHDVSVFHSCTTPCRLPSWSMCSGVGEAQALCRLWGGQLGRDFR